MEVHKNCSKISVHGFQYITDPDTGKCQKIFWILVVVSFVSLLVVLSMNLEKDFRERNTKVELDDTNAPLDEVIFPGVVICSENQMRRSFIGWIAKNLDKLDSINEIKQSLQKAFYGSETNLINSEQKLLKILLNSEFLSNYFQSFINRLNVSKIDLYPEATLLPEPNVFPSNIAINDTKMIENYFSTISGQWKYEQRFVSIKWFGNVDKREKSIMKVNPIGYTSKGICSWLGPLTKQQEDLSIWPSGVVSGTLTFEV